MGANLAEVAVPEVKKGRTVHAPTVDIEEQSFTASSELFGHFASVQKMMAKFRVLLGHKASDEGIFVAPRVL